MNQGQLNNQGGLINASGALLLNNLKDVSVEIPKRRLTVFTGVSGSGKSSLISIAAGLETPTRGRAMLFGQDMAALGEDGRAKHHVDARDCTKRQDQK